MLILITENPQKSQNLSIWVFLQKMRLTKKPQKPKPNKLSFFKNPGFCNPAWTHVECTVQWQFRCLAKTQVSQQIYQNEIN